MLDVTRFVINLDQLPVLSFEWGSIQWLCNAELSLGAKQTLGITHILPGRTNPKHYHPNCEEVLHVLSGMGRHSFGDDCVELASGMTIRIPAGVTHNLTNTGNETLTTLIAFDSGVRETVFLE
jgi:mannose-6-phosphate isomerase-like protein (cupin superfamily)